MKAIKATMIDTPGHGYLSVSKKDILKIGFPYENISNFSGHNLTRVFLEEDCDFINFMKFCEKNNIEVDIKESHKENFNITHNYDPSLFNSKFKEGEAYKLHDDNIYYAFHYDSKIFLRGVHGRIYKLPKQNPFAYVKEQVK